MRSVLTGGNHPHSVSAQVPVIRSNELIRCDLNLIQYLILIWNKGTGAELEPGLAYMCGYAFTTSQLPSCLWPVLHDIPSRLQLRVLQSVEDCNKRDNFCHCQSGTHSVQMGELKCIHT